MNELFKIIAIAVVGGVMTITVRGINQSFGMLSALTTGAVIVLSLCASLSEVTDELKSLVQSGGIHNSYIEAVLKVIGIAYITQFGADMLRDSGESAIASKCELAGKVFILYLTLPVIADFLKICIDAAEGAL